MYQINLKQTRKDYNTLEILSEKPLNVSLAKKVVCEAWGFDEYPLECTEPVQNGSVYNFEYNGYLYELSCHTMQLIKSEPKKKFKLPDLTKMLLLCNLFCIVGSFGLLAMTHNRTYTILGLMFTISFITQFFILKLKHKNNGK